MSKIDQLIEQLCPNGVEYKELGKIVKIFDNLRIPITKSNREKGIYPYYGANGIQDYVNDFIFDGEFILMGEDGSVINKDGSPVLNWAKGKIWVNNHAHVLGEIKNIALLKYVFYSLQTYNVTSIVSGLPPKINQKNMSLITIPIPPLTIQEEIVRILDTFTELQAELETELQTRKMQYEYYRNQLLNFEGKEVEWKTLGEVACYRRGSFPQPYGDVRWYNGDGAMPFVQVADVLDNMCLKRQVKQQISKLAQPKSVFVPTGTVIVTLQGSIGRVAITQFDAYVDRTLAIFERYKININKKYFAYQLQKKFEFEKETARGSTIKTITKEEFTKFLIPIPPIEEQERIIDILDKFDALVNDISIGLPAEIELRKKQYEYYRNKLLTFKKL